MLELEVEAVVVYMFCNDVLFISINILGVYTVDNTFLWLCLGSVVMVSIKIAYEILTLEIVFKE